MCRDISTAAAASRRDLSSASAALVFAAWLYVHPKLLLPVMAEQSDLTGKTSFVGDEERNCEVIFEWLYTFYSPVLSVNIY